MKSEFELIEFLRKKIPRKMQGGIGIGDDAGVVSNVGAALRGRPHKGRPNRGAPTLLFTSDTIVEGVDFLIKETPARSIGRKALAVNLSDIAAMGGVPVAFVVSLGIPKKMGLPWIEKFYDGIIALAREYKVLCVGGDISRSREFFVSIALLARAHTEEIVTRRGAWPGDLIAVTGRLGGSIHGHHLSFAPRIPEGRFLAEHFHPTSMIDLSDGLYQDLGHILKASGASAILDLEKIPISSAAYKLSFPLIHALTDGEDFELLFTVSPAKKEALERIWKSRFPRLALNWIGQIIPGKGKISWRQKGKPVCAPRVQKKGFRHF